MTLRLLEQPWPLCRVLGCGIGSSSPVGSRSTYSFHSLLTRAQYGEADLIRHRSGHAFEVSPIEREEAEEFS